MQPRRELLNILQALNYLALNYNHFIETLPNQYSGLVNLDWMGLSGNSLTGINFPCSTQRSHGWDFAIE
jgi:hypothetical protein